MASLKDRRLIYGAAFLRAFSLGLVSVLWGPFLRLLQWNALQVGMLVSLGLLATTAVTALVLFGADRIGRRRFLLIIGALSVMGTIGVDFASSFGLMALVTFCGVFNSAGKDYGAAFVLELAMLPSTAADAERTKVIARYNMLRDMGLALGNITAGLPYVLQRWGGISERSAFQWCFALAAGLLFLTLLFYMCLGKEVEILPHLARVPVSPETRRTLWKMSSLFSLDALGGGLLRTPLLAYFFAERFGVHTETLALLFFVTDILGAFSHLVAAWLAQRIGLVNTMVFTHIPSSIFLITVPFAPNFPIAAILFALREGLGDMDVPTRQSYLMALVQPQERTVASGVTQLVRSGAWVVGPYFSGLFMQSVQLAMPLYVGAGMKITYDLLLYKAFHKIRPPEEVAEDRTYTSGK